MFETNPSVDARLKLTINIKRLIMNVIILDSKILEAGLTRENIVQLARAQSSVEVTEKDIVLAFPSYSPDIRAPLQKQKTDASQLGVTAKRMPHTLVLPIGSLKLAKLGIQHLWYVLGCNLTVIVPSTRLWIEIVPTIKPEIVSEYLGALEQIQRFVIAENGYVTDGGNCPVPREYFFFYESGKESARDETQVTADMPKDPLISDEQSGSNKNNNGMYRRSGCVVQ